MSKFLLAVFLLSATATSVLGAPWDPECRCSDQNWMNAHTSFVERTWNDPSSIKILFMGASITDWWPDNLWNEKYAPLGAVNYGLSGDSIQNAFWRIQNGEIEGLAPHLKLLVLSDCGSNNVGGGNSAQDIAQGYTAVIQYLRQRLPNTRILLMGLMPRDSGNIERWTRLIDVNIRNSKHDNGEQNSPVKYLDLWNQYSSSWGQIQADLFNGDQLHLSDAGYRKWAQIQDPVIANLIA